MDERYAETLRKQEAKKKEIEERKLKYKEQISQKIEEKPLKNYKSPPDKSMGRKEWICTNTDCKIIFDYGKSGKCSSCGKTLEHVDSETASKIRAKKKNDKPSTNNTKILTIIGICFIGILSVFAIGNMLSPDETIDSTNYVDTSTEIDTNNSNTNEVISSDENSDYDDGWTTVTMLYPEIISSSDEMYYEGYAFAFQIKGDSSSTMFVVPDTLYYNKFRNYAMKSEIKIKYHRGTGKANNGATFPINIVTDVKAV